MPLCKICKKKEAVFDYGLCVDCDQFILDNKDEIQEIARKTTMKKMGKNKVSYL